jgi:hypothetical protein
MQYPFKQHNLTGQINNQRPTGDNLQSMHAKKTIPTATNENGDIGRQTKVSWPQNDASNPIDSMSTTEQWLQLAKNGIAGTATEYIQGKTAIPTTMTLMAKQIFS